MKWGACLVMLAAGTLPGCGGSSAQSPSPQTPTAAVTASLKIPPGARGYHGNGDKGLGTIVLRRDSEIVWEAQGGGIFTVFNSDADRHAIELRSTSTGGTTVIPAGTYHDVSVQAYGSWSFYIR